MKPICFDLFCGLGGWAEGFLAEGFDVIGFDIERHNYGTGGYPGQLVLQDVLTLHGSQFRNAACIVASPPCQEYSYMAMPWKRAKQIARALRGDGEFPAGYTGSRTIAQLTALFDACFRIQREASEAAGRHIPLVVENVQGAQRWVGRAKWHFGSYFLWGDVPALMPSTRTLKINGYSDPRRNGGKGAHLTSQLENNNRRGGNGEFWNIWTSNREQAYGRKVPGMNFHDYEKTGQPGRSFQSAAVKGVKACAQTRGLPNFDKDDPRRVSGAGVNRKAASAQIAKIPADLARWVAKVYKPECRETTCA